MKKFQPFVLFITILTAVLTLLISPTSSNAGDAFETLYNGTGNINFNHSFTHNDPINVACGGEYINKMRTETGTVTNNYVRIHNHKVTPEILSGSVNGGIANLQDTENSNNTKSSTAIFNVPLQHNAAYIISWNQNMNWQPINRAVQVMQRFHSGGVDSESPCTDIDIVTFSHGSLNVLELNVPDKTNFNSSQLLAIEKNLENSEFILIDDSYINSDVQSTTFTRDDILIDVMISNGQIEWSNEIDREIKDVLNIITSKNIENTDVYTLEIGIGDNQYIYLTSILGLDELMEYVDL